MYFSVFSVFSLVFSLLASLASYLSKRQFNLDWFLLIYSFEQIGHLVEAVIGVRHLAVALGTSEFRLDSEPNFLASGQAQVGPTLLVMTPSFLVRFKDEADREEGWYPVASFFADHRCIKDFLELVTG